VKPTSSTLAARICNIIGITFLFCYILVSFKFWCRAPRGWSEWRWNMWERCRTVFAYVYQMCIIYCHARNKSQNL